MFGSVRDNGAAVTVKTMLIGILTKVKIGVTEIVIGTLFGELAYLNVTPIHVKLVSTI